ncbi:Non-specific serine/threonine protein kinase [Bertholletia excelsa]
MSLRDIITWNTLISGVANCEAGFRWILYLGFSYFKRMLSEMVRPDYITFISLLAMSNGLNDIEIGRQLHCLLVKLGFGLDKFVIGALLDFYSKFGLVEYARRSFDCCLEKDTVVWNGMVSCYASNSLPKEAFSVFRQMQLEGVKGDGFTFSSLLNSTIMLRFSEFGRQLHGLVIRLSFDLDMVVASALVDMYAKNDNIVDARKAFDEMIFKNIVVWNTMIVGYGKIGEGKEAMKLLLKMFQSNLCPDELTLASVLSSCGNMSSCTEIMQVHAYTIRKGFQNFISISNSLINAYSKSGSIALALKCYGSISEPDLVSWTSMIVAYGFHGLPKESVELFEKMIRNGITPDRVAFLGVLSACSHGGLVNEGLHYFNLMINYYHIEPDLEHYTCLVDLLGRAGLLHEAFYVLTLNPIELGSDMLGSFIGACNVHRNSKLAKWAAEKLFVLNPEEPLNYSILSNVYASDGCWLDVARVHKMMKSSGNHKVPGCSLIEIAGELHTFISEMGGRNPSYRDWSSGAGGLPASSPNSVYSSSSRRPVTLAIKSVARAFLTCLTPPEEEGPRKYGESDGTEVSSGNKVGGDKKRGLYGGSNRGIYGSLNGSTRSRDPGSVKFTISDIYKATRNFSPALKIGQGGFGTVYKGQLEDGTPVAIKRAKKLVYDNKHLRVEFEREIQTLGQVEHLNLVKFYGYLEHEHERLVVVEFVPNGTLREHLDCMYGSFLDLGTRLDIAIDVAHAITYLHTYTDHPIIHRDIKSSNILLTENLRAKVADFGFARLAADSDSGATHVSTQVKGTAGYLDPEYLRTYQLTEKSDVYSFGVLLVELITGRRAIEPKRELKERVTPKWAMAKFSDGDAISLLDPKLEQSAANRFVMEKMLDLAWQCLAPHKHDRPAMKKCAQVLWGIRKEYRESMASDSRLLPSRSLRSLQ